VFLINVPGRAQETGESPYPIEYTVNELTKLLTPDKFPDMDVEELRSKLELLKQAYFKYCGTLPGCSSGEGKT